ncbi:MAG: hypothetical protein WBX27_11735 [Specibacter sp.]
MSQQESSDHAEIHEGGYGAPMPEDEMPAPAEPDATAGGQEKLPAGVDHQESGQPEAPDRAD